MILSNFLLAECRVHSVPDLLGFILGFEYETDQKSGNDGSCDATGAGFQAAGENAEKAIFADGLLDPLGKIKAKSSQGNGSAGSGKIHQWLIEPYRTQ